MRIFKNYEELKKESPESAKELLNHYGEGEWQAHSLRYFATPEHYAENEIVEGWYADAAISRDWNGAPDLMDHINLSTFSKALEQSWDTSSHFKTSAGEVIISSYGF